MSVFDTSSFNDESSPDLHTGSTVELDEAEIEAQTRRLLGLADDSPLDDEGFTDPQPPASLNPESPQTRGEVEAPSEAVPSPPPAASDDDLEPRLAAPSDAETDDDGGENFVIVDPEVDDLPVPVDGIPSDAPDTHAGDRGGEYDWNTYIGTLFSSFDETQRREAVVNVFTTWDDLNRLPGHYQQAINAMLDGSFDPARFFPQTAPAPTPTPPASPVGADPWSDDPTPAVVTDPRVDQLEQQLTQVQMVEARRVQADIESGAAAAFDEFTRSHPELSREEVDAIALAVNRNADYIYSRYSQGVPARDVWLEVADNTVWQSPDLRRKVAEAELAKEQRPVREAIAQANQRAANAAKVAGGGAAPKTPLNRGAKQRQNVGPDGTPLQDLDLTRAIADELKGSPKVVVEANPEDAPPRSALSR